MDFGHRLPFDFPDEVRTDRLRLRMMTATDVDAVYSYQSRADVCEYLLFDPRDRETVAAKVGEHSRSTTLKEDGDYWQIAVELGASEPEAGRMVGDVYFTLASAENSGGEIGWTFHPDVTGRGYASEAARAVLGVAFDGIGLHRVRAELDARNAASIALCRRLGMREEALLLQDMWFKGDWSDTGVYAILRPEWEALQRG